MTWNNGEYNLLFYKLRKWLTIVKEFKVTEERILFEKKLQSNRYFFLQIEITTDVFIIILVHTHMI